MPSCGELEQVDFWSWVPDDLCRQAEVLGPGSAEPVAALWQLMTPHEGAEI